MGLTAWTVALSVATYKGTAYRSCRGNSTAVVNIDVAWNSASLHNGAQLVIMDSVKLFQRALAGRRPGPGHLQGGALARSSGL